MIKKIKFYKSLLIEVIETLCTICLVLDRVCARSHTPDGHSMRGHFMELKKYSEKLRKGKQYE